MNKKLSLFLIGVCIVSALLGHFVEELSFFKLIAVMVGFMGCAFAFFAATFTKICPHCFKKVPDRSEDIKWFGYARCIECGRKITAYYDGKSGPTL